jgi:hypothetical protein
MRTSNALLSALLILCVAAPSARVAAAAAPPAGSDAPSATFNVARMALYPAQYDDYVAADSSHAFLVDSRYDAITPPNSHGYVDVYNVSDAQNPQFERRIGGTGQTIGKPDAQGDILAFPMALRSYYSSAGAFEAYHISSGDKICHTGFDYDLYGGAGGVAVRPAGDYAFVGVSTGLTVLDLAAPVNGECVVKTLFPSATVYAIAQVGTLLYLAQYTGIRLVNVADPLSPAEVDFYPTPHPAYWGVAVSPANYVYAVTDYGLDIIDGASGNLVTHYGPNSTVTVALDSTGNTAYMGTRDDLQVLDVSDPRAPQLIGVYADPNMEFERGSAFGGGFVHSPKGIYQYRPDVLLEARSAGVAVNGVPLAAGSSVVINGSDQITLATPQSAAAMKVSCSPGKVKYVWETGELLWILSQKQHPTAIQVAADLLIIGAFGQEECDHDSQTSSLAAGPPALPLHLVDGAVHIQVGAIAGAVQLDTTYAGTLTAGGAIFEGGYDPTAGMSQFVCLAGALQVQPTAPGALPLTLGPAQYVDVTAAGAGPVGHFRFVYLPAALR